MNSAPQSYRSTDPHTSREATEHVAATGSRGRHIATVIDTIHRHPGRTSYELATLCGLERHEVARRTADAESCGAVRKGLPRRQANGRSGVTWWPL